MSVSLTLAHAISARWPGDLPDATTHATARALLDAIAVMLAASGLSVEAAPYRAIAEREQRPDGSQLIGSDLRVSAQAAALANGALAHALDYGDTFDAGPAHPNAALVPALLALAEQEPGIDGRRFVTAMALGSDLACRLSLVAGPAIEQRGWYPPPLYGLVGAAAGCAYLLALDARGITDAIGLALAGANFPGEIKHDARSPLRGTREAFAAQGAVTAALLAREGARAFDAPLEGEAGFFAIFAGGDVELSPLTDGLGQRFVGDDVSFKPWPSCRGTHAYIEAALALRATPRFSTDRLAALEVTIGPVQEMLVFPSDRKNAPLTVTDAKFSIPYTVAVALVHGAVTLDSFDEAARANRQVRHVAAMVQATREPGWTRAHAASGRLTLRLTDGTSESLEILQALGHPSRPLSDAQLIAKFVACAGRARQPLGAEVAERLARRILAAATLPSAAEILRA